MPTSPTWPRKAAGVFVHSFPLNDVFLSTYFFIEFHLGACVFFCMFDASSVLPLDPKAKGGG
jgi:hypothetical protein